MEGEEQEEEVVGLLVDVQIGNIGVANIMKNRGETTARLPIKAIAAATKDTG